MTTTSIDRRIYVADLTPSEQGTLDQLIFQWRAKRPRNNLRTAFYDLQNSERELMSSQIPDVVKRRRFVLGWSGIAVDKLNRRCNLDGFYDVAGTDLADLGLDEIVRDNRLISELSQAGTSSLIHAVSWLVTTQGDTAAGEPDVLINARDASTATGLWDVRRRTLSAFLSISALDDKGEPVGMVMYLPNLNVMMTKVSGRWIVTRRAHRYGVPVDPMRYGARIGRSFGRSRISRSVMSIHSQALAAMIRADVNGEAYSMPRYVLLGATESAFQNADGSPTPGWRAAWKAVWAIGDDEEAATGLERADIKQFNGQSPEPQNAHLRMLAQLFSGETGIPTGELGITSDANPTSADSLLASRDDLIATAEETMDGWTPDVSSAVTRALTMKTRSDLPASLEVRPMWRNARYVSRAAAADAGSKILDKMPWLAETEVGLELVGLSPDQIRRALAERRRTQGTSVLDRLRAVTDQQPTDADPAV